MNMSSAVIQVRQNIYQDTQYRDAVRVMPFTDIQYAGADVASTNSVIASCLVPMVTGLAQSRDGQGMNPTFASDVSWTAKKLENNKLFKDGLDGEVGDSKAMATWLSTGFGLSDYLMGINQMSSFQSLQGKWKSEGRNRRASFNKARLGLYLPMGLGDLRSEATRKAMSSIKETSVDGTYPIKIMQWTDENTALDWITKNPSEMIIGYVIGPRDVKLYYTETAISMMVRRMGRAVEALSSMQPMHAPIGLGHLVSPSKPRGKDRHKAWEPLQDMATPIVEQPSLAWDAGNVTYGHRALPAAGSLYIPSDQVPYSQQRRGYKFNHMLTQVGLELLEVLQAIGADMNEDLQNQTSAFKDRAVGASEEKPSAGVEVAALQMLFASMFGSVQGATNAADFTVDEAGVASQMKEMLGMLFNSGHIHIDPGVLTYANTAKETTLLDQSASGRKFKYKGKNVSAALLMSEFVAKYVTFCALVTALKPYFQVPTWQCHWLYVGSPKPEYVTEQLQMNFRSDVYYDGGEGNSLPFTLIPSTLNPGQVLSRIPCMMNIRKGSVSGKTGANLYLGIRDPLPYGSVQELRFFGDRPVSVIEEKEYTFTPIIEADASVMSSYRNARTVNMAVWPRPTVYAPGATRMGVIYGTMADNAKVGGHYYYQYLTGALQKDGQDDRLYRAMADDNDTSTAGWLLAGQGKKQEELHIDAWNKKKIGPDQNPQMRDDPQKIAGAPIGAFVEDDTVESPIIGDY